MKKYDRSILFSEKDKIISKLSELRVVAFALFAKKSGETIVTLWILITKNVFFVAQPGGNYFISACQGCFNCTQLHIHTSCPSTSLLLFWNVVWNFFERILFTLRHLQSLVVAFVEQVQNIEKSKASFVEVVSCFATVKARVQERQSDWHTKPS